MNGTKEVMGALFQDGKVINNPVPKYSDLILTKDNRFILDDIAGSPEKISRYLKDSKWVMGTTFTLVENGKISLRNTEPHPHYKERHPRTAIGQKLSGEIVLVKVEGRSLDDKGVTGKELAQIMLDEGCTIAVNLDGGGSAEISSSSTATRSSPGCRGSSSGSRRPSRTGGPPRPEAFASRGRGAGSLSIANGNRERNRYRESDSRRNRLVTYRRGGSTSTPGAS
jgi:hypothetical protein